MLPRLPNDASEPKVKLFGSTGFYFDDRSLYRDRLEPRDYIQQELADVSPQNPRDIVVHDLHVRWYTNLNRPHQVLDQMFVTLERRVLPPEELERLIGEERIRTVRAAFEVPRTSKPGTVKKRLELHNPNDRSVPGE